MQRFLKPTFRRKGKKLPRREVRIYPAENTKTFDEEKLFVATNFVQEMYFCFFYFRIEEKVSFSFYYSCIDIRSEKVGCT